MTNAKVCQGFHDDKKVEGHWCRWNSTQVSKHLSHSGWLAIL